MAFTVKQALKQLAQFCGQSGTCWDDPLNLEMLNSVRNAIYDRSDFEGTIDWICPSISDGCFRLPLQFTRIISAWACSGRVAIGNRHFATFSRWDAQQMRPCGTAEVRATGKKYPFAVEPRTPYAFIRCNNKEDEGKVVRMYDANRKKLIEHHVDQEGSNTGTVITNVTSVSKDETIGDIDVWSVGDGEQLLASYLGPITVPEYVGYTASGLPPGGSVVLCVKKTFIPYTDYELPCDIASIQALIHGYQAKNRTSANDDAGYASAIKLMFEALQKADATLSVDSTGDEQPFSPTYTTWGRTGRG